LLVREAFWQSMQVGGRHTHIFRKPPIKLDASLKAVHKDRLAWLKIGRLALYDLACDFDASDTRKGGDDLGFAVQRETVLEVDACPSVANYHFAKRQVLDSQVLELAEGLTVLHVCANGAKNLRQFK
jgi:hypothetical protein